MSKKPVHEVRLGRIKAAIWENETQNGSLLQRDVVASCTRTTTSGRTPRASAATTCRLVAKVADLCHTWIFQQKREENGGNGNGGGKKNGGKEDF